MINDFIVCVVWKVYKKLIMDKDKIFWIWLASLEHIGNRKKIALTEYFGSAEAVFHADEKALKEAGLKKEKELDAILKHQDLRLAERAMAFMKKENIVFLTIEDADYPAKLKNIYNPPAVIFMKGNSELLKRKMNIAIVGSRKASSGGRKQAESFGEALSGMGLTVISGLAEGIDSAAHTGALRGIGSTIAVMGTGVNLCYPPKNAELYYQIAEKGLLISEFFMDEPARTFHFPLRNRIISGLSDGVLVVEARKKSGALITADHALEQGKNVYAIPQDIRLSQSIGSNKLLKEGAKIVTDPSDVLEDYITDYSSENNQQEQRTENKTDHLNEEEQALYKHILNGVQTLDELELVTGLPVPRLNSLLMMMELKDVIKVSYGQISLL